MPGRGDFDASQFFRPLQVADAARRRAVAQALSERLLAMARDDDRSSSSLAVLLPTVERLLVEWCVL